MDDLVVNDQLPTTIIDHQCSNAASAVCESGFDSAIEASLINDPQTLLDVSCLGHADDQTVGAHVEDAVLLVDGAEHALDIDAGLRVAHEGAFFLKLASEEIHAQVPVLTCLWRGGDADDLAWATLQDDEIADADELAGNRDGVGREASARLDEADLLAHALSHATRTTFFIFDDHLFAIMMVMVVAEGVCDTIGSTLEAAAEGVIFALVVVVTHIVAAGLVDLDVFFFDWDFLVRSATIVLDVVGRVGAAAVVTLSYVELGLESLVSRLSAIDVDVDSLVVSATTAFDVDVDLGVFVLTRLPVAKDSNQPRFSIWQFTLGAWANADDRIKFCTA